MTHTRNQVCLLFGSNIEPESNLPRAIRLLAGTIPIQRVSSAWETKAVGSDGPNFINAAVLASTSLDPITFKERVLRPLEATLGRVRSSDKNAPRTVDIDIVLWEEQTVDPDLTLHAYIAVPVSELLPDLNLPDTKEALRKTASRLSSVETIRKRSDVVLTQ